MTATFSLCETLASDIVKKCGRWRQRRAASLQRFEGGIDRSVSSGRRRAAPCAVVRRTLSSAPQHLAPPRLMPHEPIDVHSGHCAAMCVCQSGKRWWRSTHPVGEGRRLRRTGGRCLVTPYRRYRQNDGLGDGMVPGASETTAAAPTQHLARTSGLAIPMRPVGDPD